MIIKTAFVIITLFIFFIFFKTPVHSKSDDPSIPLEANPSCIAVNPATGIIVISNEKSDSVSVVDQNTQTIISTIPVGRAPKGTAIDSSLNIAVIANSKDNSVTFIDLNTLSEIKTVSVGKSPLGIAVNPLDHTALVANQKDGTVSIIDLTNFELQTNIQVGQEPVDIAVDPLLNIALVLNTKDYNVSVIDLNTYQVTGTINAGQKPLGIDINLETHIADIVNEKDDFITTINLKTWQSGTISVGKRLKGIAINPLDNRALVISDKDSSLVLIDLDTNSIVATYFLNKLPRGVAVNNLTNTAAVTDDKTDGLTLIQLPNPVPQISSINPDNALRGSTSSILTIEGSGFIKSSVVAIQGISQTLQTELIDNHTLRATMPGKLLQNSGAYQLTVTNPSPAGGISNSTLFTVDNPVPSIFMLEPAEAMAGAEGATLSIYGTGLFEDTEVYFGNIKKPVTFVNNSKLQVYLSPEDLKTPGLYEIAAHNSSPGGGHSNKLVFTIKSPLGIRISSPAEDEAINRGKVMVKGTIKSASRDVGVTVNGIVADITGSEWVANNVPLTKGPNVITATATDSLGNTAAETITVNTNETPQNVDLYANITSGISPLTTHFSISTSFVPVLYQMDFEGDGVVDYTGAIFEGISHTYATEGIFYPTVTVTDAQGNALSDTIAITVLSKTEMDALLKEKWNGMKEALSNGDIEEALKYFVNGSKEKYKSIFEALKDQLPGILSTFVELNISDVYENLAVYEIIANENDILYSYPGLFIRDAGGLWKFRDF